MADRFQNVSPGGLFHSHKVKYSSETEAFIRELIRESKLSIFQRQKVEESVRNGEPLPLPPSKTARGVTRNVKEKFENSPKKYILPRRRKKDAIQQMGAYERQKFLPSFERANHDVEKTKLQEVMAFGRTLKSGKLRKESQSLVFKDEDDTQTNEKSHSSKETILNEIADDIEDRKKFLERMEAIGQGKQYKDIIKHEIQEKLRLADNICKKFDKLELIKKANET